MSLCGLGVAAWWAVTCRFAMGALLLGFVFAAEGAETATSPRSSAGPSTSGATLPPSLAEMASAWLEVSEIAHMPSLHNFHDMAACAPDLLGVNYNPDGQLFDWPTGPRWFRYITLPLLQLSVNGTQSESQRCRWFPHQAVRTATTDGLHVRTVTRMHFEGPGLLYSVVVKNKGSEAKSLDLAIRVPGSIVHPSDGERIDGAVVAFRSTDPRLEKSHAFGDTSPQARNTRAEQLEMVHAFARKPTRIEQVANESKSDAEPAAEGDNLTASDNQASHDHVTATWTKQLAPGESFKLQFVMVHGWTKDPFPASSLVATAVARASAFDSHWKEVQARWGQRWQDMFTPGNEHFSGHLPLLETADEKLSDIYYRSALTLLVLHRTNMKMCDRVFVTSGERDKGVVFFWDTSMWSNVFALLEPEGMNEHVKLFLACDPHKGPVYGMDDGTQWEGWYAANDSTIFTFVRQYLNATGDVGFLDEQVAGQTVLQHLDKLATNWQKLHKDKSVMLADYGENRNLLECAPAYIHRVPSFNAANVWMMRSAADFHELHGDRERADQLRAWADQFAKAVLEMYKPGDGVWFALHRDGQRVELRHCYDFVCIGKFMGPDLTPQMKQEMVDFVKRELITDRWMRAMSPRDRAAAKSDRPDHGPLGAYDAWPALTAESMCFLGAWKPAVDFLRSTQAVLYEGVYGQSREYYGERRMEHDAPVRIAMRGACMRESVGGGAFAEVMIDTLFGFRPEMGRELTLYEPKVDRGFTGRLLNVRHHGKLLDIHSDANGVHFEYQQ